MKRKIIVLTIIILEILGVFFNVTPVFASITKENDKGTITVSNIENEVNVDIYRLLNVSYNYEADQPNDTCYSWNENVKGWVDRNFPNYSDPEKFYEDVKNMSDDSQAFYDKLTSTIKSGDISLTPTATKKAQGVANYPVQTKNLDSSVVFEKQEMGTYLIIIENGYMVYTPSVVNLVPTFKTDSKTWVLENQTATIKATNPTITKYVSSSKTSDNFSTEDELNYTIEADVPKYLENSLNKDYYISDNLENGLILDKNSVKVSGIKGETKSALEDGFTINYDSARPNQTENSTFVINFEYDKIKNYDKIQVEYKAKLNQNSSLVLGLQGNSNVGYLDYTSNPYVKEKQEATKTQETERVKVFTYGIEIEKVDKNNTKTKLSGAEFNLLDEEENLLYFVKEVDGVYYLGEKGKDGAVTNLAVNSSGKLSIKGLDEGKYNVKEIHAPDGYNISTKIYEVEIKDTNVDGVLNGDEDGIFSLQFPNTKGFVIPLTGGRGSYLYLILGVSFIIIGLGVFIIAYKKKNKKK